MRKNAENKIHPIYILNILLMNLFLASFFVFSVAFALIAGGNNQMSVNSGSTWMDDFPYNDRRPNLGGRGGRGNRRGRANPNGPITGTGGGNSGRRGFN